MSHRVFSKCAAVVLVLVALTGCGNASKPAPEKPRELAGAAQPRNGFSYLLRLDGRSISTVDGQLAPGVRPLIRRLARLEDRMLLRGE